MAQIFTEDEVSAKAKATFKELRAKAERGEMPDEDDRVFYEICLSKEDSFLVTGNLKHFPKEPQVITAAEMMEILDNEL